MRFIFTLAIPLLIGWTVIAADPVKTQTIKTFADGRRVIIEETVEPPVSAKVRRAIIVEEPAPVVEEIVFLRPAVKVFGYVAAPGVAIVEERRGFFGNLREVKVNGRTTERYGPLGFPKR